MNGTSGGRADVVVVGGGVIGLSVAYELLQRGRRVLVLDRGDPVGVATRSAGGMLAPISEAEVEDAELLRFAMDSLGRYPAFVAGLEELTGVSCEHRTEGTLWVALTRDDEAELEHLGETLRIKKLPFQPLTGRQVLKLEPHLSGRVLAGLRVEQDHQVDPRSLTVALEKAVGKLGGEIRVGARVREILAREDRLWAAFDSGDGRRCREGARAVVLAAGAWSSAEIVSPLSRLGVRPVKGQLLRLGGAKLLEHVLRLPHLYLVPRASGKLLVGATMEEMGFDPAPTAGAVHDLLRRAWEVLPGLYDMELEEVSVGFRPVVRDNRPVIDTASIDGLYAAVGHGRGGILLAPATAHYLAEAITAGRMPAALEPFGGERLLDGSVRSA